MKNDTINLLVTFDKNYIGPFKTMLKSLVVNNAHENLHIWLLHSAIPEEFLNDLDSFCTKQGADFTPIQVDREIFKNAPISKRYPQEMYYRLLAPVLLPEAIEKVLYLDPDILVINPIRPLWNAPLGEYSFAAASHTGVIDIKTEVNQVRLGIKQDYFNSGVMLMDLKQARSFVNADDIFRCVNDHEDELILPDQDVFNLLYGSATMAVDDAVWNYDARFYPEYLIKSSGEADVDWVIRNTVFLHFCGKRKPWLTGSAYPPTRFDTLYKHYMQLTAR